MWEGDPVSDFPLPVAWLAPIGWSCFLWDAPVVAGDEVIVRAGPAIVGLDAGSGRERWKRALPGSDLGGEIFGAAGDVLFADVTADRAQRLVGATRDRVLWQRPLGGTVVRGGCALHGGRIAALVAANRDVALVHVDPATGAEERHALPARGATFAAAGDELIVMSPTANPGAPGAYVLGAHGDPARVLRTGDVWGGAIAGGWFVSTGQRQRLRHVIELRELAGALRWSDACFTEAASIDGRDVAYAARAGDATALVLRDAETGDVRWRAGLGDVEPAAILFAATVVVVRHMLGAVVVRRADGQVVGESFAVQGFRAAVAGRRLFLGGDQHVIAAELPA
jgi:outer membrane protein assembly factor BamB